MNYLTVKEVLDAHAQFGKLDRAKIKIGMGPNWPSHWNLMLDGEGIFS